MAKKVEDAPGEKESKRVYSRYMQNPIFWGLIILALLLAMTTFYFASGAKCSITGYSTGTVVTADDTTSDIGSGGAVGTYTGGATGGDTAGAAGDALIIYEFSEFKCPYCAAAAGFNTDMIQQFRTQDPSYEPVLPKIKGLYADQVNLVFKHFIVHDSARKAGEAVECARDQDRFWEMHDIMFENMQNLEPDDLKSYAAQIGLDAGQFNACLDSGEKAQIVQADTDFGRSLGVSGTPTFFIGGENGYKVVGAQPFSAFEDSIESALAGEAPSQPAPQPAPEPVVDLEALVDDDPSLGSPDAPVTIVEFSEFLCPFCTRFTTQTLPQIEEEYVQSGKVRIVYRDFIIHGLPAQLAHEAAECADDQGKFWEYHDELFGGAGTDSESLKQIAVDLGLGTAEFNECVGSRKYQSEVEEDTQDGRELGVGGTPTIFINGKKIVGAQPYAVFKEAIDEELNKI